MPQEYWAVTVREGAQRRIILFEDERVATAYARRRFECVMKAIVASEARIATLYIAELDEETGAIARRIEEPLFVATDEDTRGLEEGRRERSVSTGLFHFIGGSLISAEEAERLAREAWEKRNDPPTESQKTVSQTG